MTVRSTKGIFLRGRVDDEFNLSQSSDSEVRELLGQPPNANFGIKGALADIDFSCGFEFEVPMTNSRRN